MHRGVQELIRWVEAHQDFPGVALNRPATTAELNALEQQLGVPLPADLRLVMARFNGGTLPNGTLLVAGVGPGTIEAAVRAYAEAVEADFLDPELLLPFFRTIEGSLLCFDRSAAPISDTWPIVDYFEDTGETRLVFRTFDGWCRTSVASFESPDFLDDFSLEKYLAQGKRHALMEPDVATAHATVAHAFKRAGRPEEALSSYLDAARCVPPLTWCDWEALKLAVLLHRLPEALEAATRLCMHAPSDKWNERDTTPATLADVIGRCARLDPAPVERSSWTRLLDQLVGQCWDDAQRKHVKEVRKAVVAGSALPPAQRPRDGSVVPAAADLDIWWSAAKDAYAAGVLREDDMLLDPNLDPLRAKRDLSELLRIRRDF